ncbi:hypothetical protein [Natronobiforma cellulositropha]|uniref:hypothetical protein n=1 Tax=Natronobiforma cellulositropha TaxID=1679076 RepID=UPI0021D5B2AD|nr:hypothetical protein [Natronobiforma cellulositropha]
MDDARCGECDWVASADPDADADLNLAMIDHYYQTGHTPVFKVDAVSFDESDARTATLPEE